MYKIQRQVTFSSVAVILFLSLTFGANAQTHPDTSGKKRLIDTFDSPPAQNAASIHAFVEKLKTAIDNGADIDAIDKYGNNPLMSATYWAAVSGSKAGFNEIVAYLLGRGANPNIKTNGVMPLHFLAVGGVSNVPLVELLCSAGADPRAKVGTTGISPLDASRNNPLPDDTRAMEACKHRP